MILGGGVARKSIDVNQVDVSYTSNSIILNNDFLVGLNIILEYSEDVDIAFEINEESIIGECISISDTRSECIISTESSGQIISANEVFEIVSIVAAAPGKYLDVNLSEIPLELSIGNAYPNPFNPRVKFDYSLPFESEVEVLVYNINGQMISELVDASMQSGKYSIEWNAGEYSSGVYFVKFNINNIASTQRVTLLK